MNVLRGIYSSMGSVLVTCLVNKFRFQKDSVEEGRLMQEGRHQHQLIKSLAIMALGQNV